MKIEEFLNIKKRSLRKKDTFTELSKKCKNKEELRVLEQTYLKPEKLKKVGQFTATKETIEDRIVEVVFPDKESLTLFKKYFSVTSRRSLGVKQGLYRIELLQTFLMALENKEIMYDQKKQKFKYRRNTSGLK